MKKAFVATVQILIDPEKSGVDCEGGACDWMSGLLSENPQVKDWRYIPHANYNENTDPPTGDGFTKPVLIDIPEDYREGDAFNQLDIYGNKTPLFAGDTRIGLLVSVEDLAGDRTGYAPFAQAIYDLNSEADDDEEASGATLLAIAVELDTTLNEIILLAQRAYDDGYIEIM